MERFYEVCKDVSFSVAKDRVSALIVGMKKMILAAAALVGVTHAESTTVYVGTGADGIYTLELNEKTGALTNRQHVVKGQGMGFQEVNKAGEVIFFPPIIPAGRGRFRLTRLMTGSSRRFRCRLMTDGGFAT